MATLTDDQRREVRQWLRYPRGRYTIERASQLSGVPRSTVYDWRRHDILASDFPTITPKVWSYRELVFLRLIAFLRSRSMNRPEVADRVASIRRMLEEDTDDIVTIRSDGHAMFLNSDDYDRRSGEAAFPTMLDWIEEFYLAEPIAELGSRRLWGPNLVNPSPRTMISPWVMAGDPCLTGTRIATSSMFALHTERGLVASAIANLYPGVEPEQVRDAIELEQRLRQVA